MQNVTAPNFLPSFDFGSELGSPEFEFEGKTFNFSQKKKVMENGEIAHYCYVMQGWEVSHSEYFTERELKAITGRGIFKGPGRW